MNTEIKRTRERHPDEARATDSPALKLWVVLARAHGAIQARAAADIAGHGLTLAEFGVLEALYHKGRMLLGDVQRKLLVSSGGITYLVDRLEQAGLVERRSCPEDRRARYAALTAKGERLVRKIFPQHAQHLEQVLSGLSPAEQQRASTLLRKLGMAAEGSER